MFFQSFPSALNVVFCLQIVIYTPSQSGNLEIRAIVLEALAELAADDPGGLK